MDRAEINYGSTGAKKEEWGIKDERGMARLHVDARECIS